MNAQFQKVCVALAVVAAGTARRGRRAGPDRRCVGHGRGERDTEEAMTSLQGRHATRGRY